MTILRERQTWSKRKRGRSSKAFMLTPTEQANVLAAMRAMHKHLGSWRAVAAAIPCSSKTVEKALRGSTKPSPGLAIRLAQLAQVPVDDVLSGAFPKAGHCPRCGWGVGR